ncbi:MAG: efflux RND transporter periplasmic adaptor subunit [Saprospirales bacterium]|nr:efflux RND transporter periplasmic adaptor subunit [Saprospirales bacterium]
MSKSLTRWISLVGIGILIVVFVLYRMGYIGERTPDPAALAPAASPENAPPLPVEGYLVNAAVLTDNIEVSGSAIPEEEVQITSEIAGKVAAILFEEGKRVEKGAVLVRLNDEEWRAQREKQVVQKHLAEKIANRLKALYEKEGVSLQEYEVAAAEVDRYDAEIKLLDVQLDKTVIRAPFGGVLGLRQVSEGSYLSPGMPIVSLVRVDPIHVQFSIPEKYSGDLKVGGKVTFQLAGLEGNFPATIVARDPKIDANTRTITFEAKAPNPGGRVLPGAFTLVKVQLREFDKALMVPTEAIVPELGGKKLFLYRNGQAVGVPVITGIRQDRAIQIVDGLQPGDTVITSGILQLRPGMPVSISGWTTIK